MKQLLFSLIASVILSNVTFSQPMYLNATKLIVTILNTEESQTSYIDLNFTLTDYSLKCTNSASTIKWTFTSRTIKTSNTQFYVYANDMDGVRCRIWFEAVSTSSALVGIEYKDLGIIYYMTIR